MDVVLAVPRFLVEPRSGAWPSFSLGFLLRITPAAAQGAGREQDQSSWSQLAKRIFTVLDSKSQYWRTAALRDQRQMGGSEGQCLHLLPRRPNLSHPTCKKERNLLPWRLSTISLHRFEDSGAIVLKRSHLYLEGFACPGRIICRTRTVKLLRCSDDRLFPTQQSQTRPWQVTDPHEHDSEWLTGRRFCETSLERFQWKSHEELAFGQFCEDRTGLNKAQAEAQQDEHWCKTLKTLRDTLGFGHAWLWLWSSPFPLLALVS